MSITKAYLLISIVLFSVTVAIRLLLSSLNQTTIFIYSLFFHLIVALYIGYSMYEIFILHEKQGSKLTLSKKRFHSDWRWFTFQAHAYFTTKSSLFQYF